jgi:hypothetical protein
VYDERAGQSEVIPCDGQRLGDTRRVRVLELEAEPLAVHEQQEIELDSALGVPEIGLAVAGDPKYFLEGEPFTNAPHRMSRCRFTVVWASPRDLPISEAFQICPW